MRATTSRPEAATKTEHEVARLVATDVMSSPVITISVDDTLATAWNLLFGNNLRHLVVTRDRKQVVGVIDDRRIALEWPIGPLGPHRRLIKDLATESTHCVLPETPVTVVARIMVRERLDAVPVVEHDGNLVGIVTAGDLVAVLADL